MIRSVSLMSVLQWELRRVGTLWISVKTTLSLLVRETTSTHSTRVSFLMGLTNCTALVGNFFNYVTTMRGVVEKSLMSSTNCMNMLHLHTFVHTPYTQVS